MKQMNRSTGGYFSFVMILAGMLLLVSCNHRRLFETKPAITIYETSQQPDMLPALAVLDLQNDSENARKFIEKRNLLETGTSGDSITINVEGYLRNGEKNSLFKRLRPNVNTGSWQTSKPLYVKSSFLGFSNPADTITVNQMLNDSGLLLYGSHIAWADCDGGQDKPAMALAVIPPGAKQVHLSGADVEEVKIEQQNLSCCWKWYQRLCGQAHYSVTLMLSQDAIERVQSEFPDDSALLIKCRFNDKEVYCSTVSAQIAEGFTLIHDTSLR